MQDECKGLLMSQAEILNRSHSLDTSIFERIPTQTNKADQRSLLAIPVFSDSHVRSIKRNMPRFFVMSLLRHFHRTSLNDFGIDWVRPVLENFWKKS